MIAVHADGQIIYDSRLDGSLLVGLKITTGLNMGGTAEIVMPLGHPSYDRFIGYKTNVHIYRDGVLLFRGRALYASDTFYGDRAITCEGELCFLRDTINRPYKWAASPRSCFVTLINAHNAQQPDVNFQFAVGEVTVTDPNDYIVLESESAETSLDTLNKLIERCGGYITFTDGGMREINWVASLNRKNDQIIEFGENLLDFTRTGAATTSLATGIVPYGARLEITDADGKTTTSKERLTIASVNDGKDYLIAEDAQAIRGTIFTTVTWDDITDPANLKKKAQEYLDANKNFVTTLELTALDLSYLDKDIAMYQVGEQIQVISKPHGVNDSFQLTQKTEDLLNPAQNRIVLGKDLVSLTGADANGAFRFNNAVEYVKTQIKDVDLSGLVMKEDLNGYAKATDLTGYATVEQLNAHAQSAAQTYATAAALNQEVSARAGVINKVNGVVNISGGAPVKILGGKVEIDGSEIHFGKEARFLNGSGIRIADKDGNSYYVLRVDEANSFIVGNDYTNLYLRGKEGVYLYKGGAAVTSDRREKNSIEELPEAYEKMLDRLTPLRFKYNGKGDRYHVGFVAQDVDEALTAAGLTRDDFGGFVDLKGDGSELALRYDEFIGLLLQKVRKLEKRIESMEEKKQ